MAENFPFFQAGSIDLKKLTPHEKEAYKQIKDETKKFVAHLQHNGAGIIKLSFSEEYEHKRNWFTKVVPDEEKQKAIDYYCLDKDGFKGYLWHVFSFELLDCVKDNDAKSAFDSTPKQDAVLLSNWSLGITSCRLRDISNIKADSFDVLSDVIVTDCNFEWTYVKTHESQCGPYFHYIRSV